MRAMASESGTYDEGRTRQVRAVGGRGTVRTAGGAGRVRGRADAKRPPDAGACDGHAHGDAGQQPHGYRRAAERNAGSVAQAFTDRAGRAATVAPTPTDARFTEAQVIEVVDGDTIKVLVAGEKLTLRYIGIDTPEMGGADGAGREQNIALVSGRTVRLEQDVSATDPYGRLLRYVWVGDLMVNAELVRLGYARAVAYPPDTENQALFAALQAEAQAAGRGLWANAAPPGRRAQAGADHGLRRDGAINRRNPTSTSRSRTRGPWRRI